MNTKIRVGISSCVLGRSSYPFHRYKQFRKPMLGFTEAILDILWRQKALNLICESACVCVCVCVLVYSLAWPGGRTDVTCFHRYVWHYPLHYSCLWYFFGQFFSHKIERGISGKNKKVRIVLGLEVMGERRGWVGDRKMERGRGRKDRRKMKTTERMWVCKERGKKGEDIPV